MKHIKYDICIIGAGAGGLSVAAGASQMGANVIMIEKGNMGGDCLNYGCVPSKALIAVANTAHTIRHADIFTINNVEPKINMQKIQSHIKDVIASIAPNDSVDRFEALGVKIIKDEARFIDADKIKAGDNIITAKYFVIATGSSPYIPNINGFENIKYYTNENIFEISENIDHLIILGGGAIAIELAQAYRRLGAKVSIIQKTLILQKFDMEAVDILRQKLLREGINIYENSQITMVNGNDNITATIAQDNGNNDVKNIKITGSHLLIACGRKVNIANLNLEAANIKYSNEKITLDQRLRTTNKQIFAIGDVRGGLQFTHVAGYDAGIVIRNILFKLPAKTNYNIVPTVIYFDPELSHVGFNQAAAEIKFGSGNYQILRWSFGENDRAICDKKTDGFIKIILNKKGLIIGATIIGKNAGELIAPWVLAINTKQKIGAMAGIILPYPTLSEISKRVAGSYYTPKIFSNKIKKITRFLMRF